MKVQSHDHLQEEQVLWAVIDEKELAGDVQQHLLDCPVCKKKVEQFRDELELLGQKAHQAVPPFTRAVELPKEKSAAVSHNNGWLPFFGAAAMGACVVFFYFMGMQTMAPTQLTALQSQEILLGDEALMFEIAEVEEAPMFEDPYDMSGENGTGFDEMYEITGDDDNGFDEDFWEFAAPDIQDDYQSEFII